MHGYMQKSNRRVTVAESLAEKGQTRRDKMTATVRHDGMKTVQRLGRITQSKVNCTYLSILGSFVKTASCAF